jgi:hypothetical protein
MKAERIELAALAAATVQRSPLEISTSAYLADFTASHAAVKSAVGLLAPAGARQVAVLSAGLPKDRAKDALSKFNAFERGIVWIALQKLIADLGQIQKCMQGGAMPARTGKAH